MSIEFGNTELTELTPRIAVVGVGGAGCNAVNNMIEAELQGVDFVVANTDAQSLATSAADNRIQLGIEITQGLGAGAQPKIGAASAEEAVDSIDETLNGCHMAFVTAGMGGGTGTGAAPVIARRAREKGILTVGVVTRPFQFEGGRRAKIADSGIAELAQNVDTLIIIPNQNLFRVANERTTFADAFNMADEVLHSGVRGITDLMVMPGLINLDFADVRTVMSEMGKAMMGTGEADGETRAQDAAAAAISNPLLEEASLKGAKGVIINVTGGMDMTLYEVDEAVNMVREQVDPDALIVFGSAFSQDLEGKLRVSVVATGIESDAPTIDIPVPQRKPKPVSKPIVTEPVSPEHVETIETVSEEASVDEPEKSVADILGAVQASLEDDVQEETPVQTTLLEEDSLEEKALAAAEAEDTFVAEAPMMPKETHSAPVEQQPEAALVDAYTEEPKVEVEVQQPVASQKRSLFQVMTAGLRGNNEVSASERVNAAEETSANALSQEAPSLGGVTDEDRTAPKAVDKDQLEIPSFLRRQKN